MEKIIEDKEEAEKQWVKADKYYEKLCKKNGIEPYNNGEE